MIDCKTDLSRSIRANQYEISGGPAPTLKNNSHFGRRLIDMPHIFLESLNNSEQNQHRCIFIFFSKIFWVRPLYGKSKNRISKILTDFLRFLTLLLNLTTPLFLFISLLKILMRLTVLIMRHSMTFASEP